MKAKYVSISLVTAICGSLIAIFVAGVSKAGNPFPLSILKWRLGAAAILFTTLAKARKKKLIHKELPYLLLCFHGGVPVFLAMLLFFYSICIGTPPGLATFLFYLFPVTNLVWAFFILKEIPRKTIFFSLALIVPGLYFMLVADQKDFQVQGIVTAIVAGFIFGLGVVLHRLYRKKGLSPLSINSHIFFWGFLCAQILEFSLKLGNSNPFKVYGKLVINQATMINISGLILIGTIAFFYLVSYLSGKMENARLGIMLTLEPALTTLFSVYMFNEKMGVTRFSGMLLILAGVGITAFRKR